MNPTDQPPLLCLDLGNSRLRALLRAEGGGEAALSADAGPADWDGAIGPLLERAERVALCSVAPGNERRLAAWLERSGKPPFIVRGDSPAPFPVQIEGRSSLGPDRLCNAAAAWAEGSLRPS